MTNGGETNIRVCQISEVRIATLEQRLEDHVQVCQDERRASRNFYRWTVTLMLGGMTGLAGWAWHLSKDNTDTIQFLIERLYACQEYWSQMGPP